MIFVDDVVGGNKVNMHITHSPWNDITLADFVMPWFLFIIGTAMAFNFRKFLGSEEKAKEGTKYALTRALKLYFLGVLLQGGDWFDPSNYSYGQHLNTIRWCGILNRIAYAYFFIAIIELWIPKRDFDYSPHANIFINHYPGWLINLLFVLIYTLMTFLTYVPSWESHYKWD